MKYIVNLKKLIRDDCILNRKYRRQLIATLTVNIIALSHGIGLGWVSPTLSQLQSTHSPLNFPITIEEASWIGSLLGLGSMCGNLISGTLLDNVGRKVCIYMVAIPHICLWVLIYNVKTVEFLYVARFLGGMTGGASYVVMPIFISEIADTCIRGTLSTMLMLSVNLGILTGFILTTHLAYHTVPFVVVILPMVYLAGVTFFPETPQHLLRKGKYHQAEQSFKYYRNCCNTSARTYDELQDCLNAFEDLKAFVAKGKENGRLTYRDFVTKTVLKAFCTATVLLVVNQFSGAFAFINYMSNIFAESGSLLDPNTCTILVGVVQILGVYTATLLIDRCGRKILMLYSTGGITVGLIIFGLFTYFSKIYDLSDYTWAPLVLMGFIVFISNIGIMSLVFTILVELFPSKVRAFAASLCMTILSFLVFVMLKIFPLYMEAFGVSISMWSCATVSFICFIYLAIFLPETKGKSMNSD